MATDSKKSLIAKLAEACDAVGGVGKSGYNEMQRYNYVKAADVAKAIRHELFLRGIVLTLDEKDYIKLRDVPTKSGGVMPEMLLKCEVIFWDGDSGEKLGPFGAFGVAMDSGDKAIYKAKTGCLKYVLRHIGLIPDEKDDPEADERVDRETSDHEDAFYQRTGKIRATPALVTAFEAMFKNSGKTPAQLATILQARYKATSPAELTSDELGELVKWAASKEPIHDTLKTSVDAARGQADAPQRTVIAKIEGEDKVVSVVGVVSLLAPREKGTKKWLGIKMADGMELSDWRLEHESTLKPYVGKEVEFLARTSLVGTKVYYSVDSIELEARQ